MADQVLTVPSGTQAPPQFVPPPNAVVKEKPGAAKFHKAFAELTHEEIKPKAEEPPPETPAVEEKPVEKPAETPVEEPKPEELKPAAVKPESPLDALVKEQPKVEEPADVLKEFDEKTANWHRAREVMKNQSTEIKTLQGRLAELEKAPKADPALVQEHEALQKKIAKQEEYLKAINAEYSDEFQSLIQKREETLGKIHKRVKAYGVDADNLVTALSLPESKFRNDEIKKAMAELDPDDKTRVAALIEKLEEHDEQITDFRKDLPHKWEEIQAKRDAQLREQQESTIKTLETEFSKVVDTLPSSTVTLREVPEFEDWNGEIKAARENALRVLKPNGANFEESVAIAVKGARYDSLEKRYLQLHKDYTEARNRLKEFDSTGPDFRGTPKPETKTKKTASEKYHEAMDAYRSGQLTGV